MTRQADINSQTKMLVFKAKTIDDEKVVEDFKKLCNQDGLQIYNLMFEAIQLVFKVHHWPPGNPQLTLQTFATGKREIDLGKCGYANCSAKAVTTGTYLPNKKEYKLCEKHSRLAKSDHLNWTIKEQQRMPGGLS